jgi:hypothetical protein
MRRALSAIAVLAAVLSPAAAGHGGGGALGFTSTVGGLRPATTGLELRVLDSDDRLELRNSSGNEVVVLGYDGEPYLRFANGAVFRNARSPATYLNDDRYGNVELPAEASAKAEPRWTRVARHEVYEWHDHRIHWMSPILPPQVRRAEDRPHHVFDWDVPLRVDGSPVSIMGSLDYAPPPGDSFNPLLTIPLLVAALAGVLLWWRRRRTA